MKVFVSGQILDLDNVRDAQNKLRAAGHEITHDWTHNETGDKMLAGPEAKLQNLEETARRARNDMQGVLNCDVYVICTSNDMAGKGMYVELGGAIALNMKTGSPKIYLIGEKKHMSIFYFHPAVIHLDTIEEVIDQIA